MQPELIHKRYRELAKTYDAHQPYSDRFVRMLSVCLVDKLKLREEDRFVDLGGGTGIYAEAILELVPLHHRVTIVDPVGEMLAQVPPALPVERVQMDALAWSRLPGECDKVLMKDAIHYVGDKTELFSNLHRKLTPGGVLVVVHNSALSGYSLFEAALHRSESWYVDSAALLKLLDGAEFKVQLDSLDYGYQIPKYQYFQMIRDRCLSVLADFTDDDLEEGIVEMEKKLIDEDVLRFSDRFELLTATPR